MYSDRQWKADSLQGGIEDIQKWWWKYGGNAKESSAMSSF